MIGEYSTLADAALWYALDGFFSEWLMNLGCLRFSARYARRLHESSEYKKTVIFFLAAWVPYFDNNLDAIIFLAPISGFDEVKLIFTSF